MVFAVKISQFDNDLTYFLKRCHDIGYERTIQKDTEVMYKSFFKLCTKKTMIRTLYSKAVRFVSNQERGSV